MINKKDQMWVDRDAGLDLFHAETRTIRSVHPVTHTAAASLAYDFGKAAQHLLRDHPK